MKAVDILNKFIKFYEKRGHIRIPNAPLVPENDPSTLFTSSGMQPLVPYLLGEVHPQGTRLVNAQNVLRAVDIDEVGDNRHTTFFRMLGNWSLGDYFKKDQLPWVFEYLTKEIGLPPKNLYVSIFEGYKEVPQDKEALKIWQGLFTDAGLDPKTRIFTYGPDKNWWSRSGPPAKMPPGEPGGPDSEVFYDLGEKYKLHEHSSYKDQKCHINCDCGRYIEIANSVFMQYKKQPDGSLSLLPKPNVDFGGGLERQLHAIDHVPDVFETNLYAPIIAAIEKQTGKKYENNEISMRIVTDHLIASSFITLANVRPSNTEQGYILRRFIRRSFDHFSILKGKDLSPVIEAIAEQYKETDPNIIEKFEEIKLTILEETKKYSISLDRAKSYIIKKYKQDSDEIKGTKEITPDDAFYLYSSHGLSPTQIKSLGYTFDEQTFAQKMEDHQKLSRKGAEHKFRGGLADHQERTIMGHTATHLMHQALRDILGKQVHQTGSNITTERVRFDFNYDQKLTPEQITQLEEMVNKKIQENLPVHFDVLSLDEAKKEGAIGLFGEKYGDKVKIYFIGPSTSHSTLREEPSSSDSKSSGQANHEHKKAYSKEFCGGPHVEFTGSLKSFKIIKQENIGNKQRRLYAVVG